MGYVLLFEGVSHHLCDLVSHTACLKKVLEFEGINLDLFLKL